LYIPQVINEYAEPRWNDTDMGKPKKFEINLSGATLSTTNPTWTDPNANTGLRDERPAINHLSHGKAQ
jgi:hypothetical protein